jgi:hypothetical protein
VAPPSALCWTVDDNGFHRASKLWFEARRQPDVSHRHILAGGIF